MEDQQPQDESPPRDKPDPGAAAASAAVTLALGIGVMFLGLALAYLFVSLWPANLANTTDGSAPSVVTWLGTGLTFRTTVDARLLLLVMVAGALGSFIHLATSFADFVGNRKLDTNWVWWYLLRPFVAMALATVFYVSIRAGFLTGGGQPNTINLYGIAAIAGLVGMFSKQATDKLGEVFDILFRTAPGAGDAERRDALGASAPALKTTEPNTPDTARVNTESSHEADGCALRVVDPTRDDALPPARGGVG